MTDSQTIDTIEPIEEQIIRTARSNHQTLPVLEVIFDRFAMALGPVMKSYCSSPAEAELLSFEYMDCGDALDSLAPSGLALVGLVHPWQGAFGLVLEPGLLFTTLEIMLGGRTANRSGWTPRAFSAIEKRFALRLSDVVLGALGDAFSRLFEVSFAVDRIEGSPQALVIAPPASPCVKVTMRVTFEDRGGDLIFLIPHTAIEPVRQRLAEPFRGGTLGGDSSWRELLTQTVQGASVTVDAVLHEPSVQLSDILSWRRGQTVDLGLGADPDVTVSVGDLRMFSAAVGRRGNGSVALRVTRDFSEREDPDDVSFD